MRVTGPNSVVYADLVGSAAETIAHLRENGRITVMWCSFGDRPRIVRMHGRGRPLFAGDAKFDDLARLFPHLPRVRSIISIDVVRIADSCGFGVPEMELAGPLDRLVEWIERKTPEELADYLRTGGALPA